VTKLTELQVRFVEEYLISGHPVQAARKAGYAESTAQKKAPMWVAEDRAKCPAAYQHVWDAVQEARQERAKRAVIDADRVMQEETYLATVDPADLYDGEGNLLKVKDMPERIRRAISSIRHHKDGSLTIRFHDKGACLGRMHKHLGCCKPDVHNHNHGLSPEAAVMANIMAQIDGTTKGGLDE
jgi:phage terminase small subunit